MKKNCLLCGDEFEAKEERHLFCKKKHYKKCPMCEVDFLLVRNRDRLTCSNKCASDYRNKNIRYDCTCKLCGKQFKGKTKRANVCEDTHEKECKVCKKTFNLTSNHSSSSTCSSSCASSLSHTHEAKENRRKKSLERHGTEFPFQAEHIVKKIKESLDNSENDTRIGSKRWNLMLEEKYNVENISQVEEIKKRKEETYYKKYGVKNPAAMKIENYKEWNDLENFLKGKDLDCLEIAEYFNAKVGSVRARVRELNIEHKVKDFYKYSSHELTVKHILKSLGLKEEKDFKSHYRKLISPLEVDFYIPSLNLAIEVSPTFTHNSKFGWNKKEETATDLNYHKNKYLLCKEKGIRLITIFEWTKERKIEEIIKTAIKGTTEEKRQNKIISVDLSIDNHYNYENLGYKKVKEVEPKLIYHNPKIDILIKSNRTIKKHKDTLERNGFLPVYNCGYEIWELI